MEETKRRVARTKPARNNRLSNTTQHKLQPQTNSVSVNDESVILNITQNSETSISSFIETKQNESESVTYVKTIEVVEEIIVQQQQPVIITLLFDDQTQKRLNSLREKYYPEQERKVEAHMTLFHAIPRSSWDSLFKNDLNHLLSKINITNQTTFVTFFPPKLVKNTKAVMILVRLHTIWRDMMADLQDLWWDQLTQQDQSKFWPHVTICNKVTKERAEEVVELVTRSEMTTAFNGNVKGIGIWEYQLDGTWHKIEDILL